MRPQRLKRLTTHPFRSAIHQADRAVTYKREPVDRYVYNTAATVESRRHGGGSLVDGTGVLPGTTNRCPVETQRALWCQAAVRLSPSACRYLPRRAGRPMVRTGHAVSVKTDLHVPGGCRDLPRGRGRRRRPGPRCPGCSLRRWVPALGVFPGRSGRRTGWNQPCGRQPVSPPWRAGRRAAACTPRMSGSTWYSPRLRQRPGGHHRRLLRPGRDVRASGREDGDVVLLAMDISRHQREILALCLGHQHPVERIPVDQGKLSGRDRVRRSDG